MSLAFLVWALLESLPLRASGARLLEHDLLLVNTPLGPSTPVHTQESSRHFLPWNGAWPSPAVKKTVQYQKDHTVYSMHEIFDCILCCRFILHTLLNLHLHCMDYHQCSAPMPRFVLHTVQFAQRCTQPRNPRAPVSSLHSCPGPQFRGADAYTNSRATRRTRAWGGGPCWWWWRRRVRYA